MNAVAKQEQTTNKWHRLIEQRDRLLELGRKEYLAQTNNCEYDMELDCIDHLFGCGGLERYEKIALFCKKNGIQRAIDIGCAYGHQSECFLIHRIDYVGVNEGQLYNFWNQDKFKYIVGHYPCFLSVKKDDLAVSVLCLTWNCYLYEGEKTLREQCEALKRDFFHCLLYMTEGAMQFVSRYFKKVVKIDQSMYYFTNRDKDLIWF